MRWHKQLLIVAASVIALAAMTVAAFGATGRIASGKKEKVKARVHQGTLTVTGTSAGETLTLRLRAGDPTNLEIDVGDQGFDGFRFKRSRFDTIVVNAGGGDDVVRIDEVNGSFTDTEATSVNGEAGNDTLQGGSFGETLLGGDGDDTVDGNRGNDVGLLGGGDDTFVWDPGDGSDIVEGQAGSDTMLFNGSNAGERIDLSANGGRLRFFRDVGAVTMDTNEVETVDLRALGGADVVTVNDLTGTGVTSVKTDLAATGGGGDGQPDQVIVDGTGAADSVRVASAVDGVANVTGLAASVAIARAEVASNDTLTINALAGDDAVDASGLAADAIKLTADGGAGDDVLIGGEGDDVLNGGAGDDVLVGGPGIDILDGGPGDNIVIQ